MRHEQWQGRERPADRNRRRGRQDRTPGDFSGSAQAAAAYFACVNANGGINGRPIHYSIEDDKWNPETAAQVAAKLVNDTKVVGMVGSSSFVDCAVNEKFYETNNVLVIAGVGVPRDCFHSRNIAPTNEGPRLSRSASQQYVHDVLQVKRLVCIAPIFPMSAIGRAKAMPSTVRTTAWR